MSKKTKIEVTRENFLKMRGGRLISAEAAILGICIAIIMIEVKGMSPVISLVTAIIVGFIFPILVGSLKSLAWLAAILFSTMWALVVGFFAAAIAYAANTGMTVLIGVLVGIVSFAISFFAHKNYSGLELHGIKRKGASQQLSMSSNVAANEAVRFCPKCGRRIGSDGRCEACDK